MPAEVLEELTLVERNDELARKAAAQRSIIERQKNAIEDLRKEVEVMQDHNLSLLDQIKQLQEELCYVKHNGRTTLS